MTENELKKISETLESLQTQEDILKHSSVIYISPYSDKHVALESLIRFEDLPLETLQAESKKLDKLMESVKRDSSVTEFTKNYINRMSNLVNNRLMKTKFNNGRLNIALEMHESAYTMPEYYHPTTESLEIANTSVKELLEDLRSLETITPKGVISVCETLFMSDNVSDGDYIDTKYELSRLMGDTVRNEMDNPDCCDLPMMKAADKCKDYLMDEFDDDSDIKERIKDIFDEFEDSIEDEIEWFFDRINHELNTMTNSCYEEFNCNPFANIYNMAPFPVGSREVGKTVDDCLNAETDEELIEALNHFAQLLTICETYGYDLITERKDSIVAKAARQVKRGTDKVVQGARQARDTAHDAKVAIDKTTDAMAKFIEQTYDDITKKDLDARKKEIMAKGLKGKLKKILRWVRTTLVGTGAMAIGSAGGVPVVTVIAAISLIGYIAKESKLEANARNEIIRELEDEIKICDEKIEDSRGDDKKQNKYELIRIRSKLEKELNRVKLRKEY